MVEFGRQLLDSRYEPWAKSYLDYESLKRALRGIANHSANNEKRSGTAEDAQIREAANTEFEELVDQQIEKVVLFFLEKQGELAKRLNDLRSNKSSNQNDDVQHSQYVQIGDELVLLVNFVELNVTGLRKILKKHDKKNHGAPAMTERYLSYYVQGDDSHLQQMYHYGGIAALVETLRLGLDDLQAQRENTSTAVTKTTAYSTLTSTQEVQPILDKICQARRRLKQSSRYAQAMAAQALFIFDDASDVGSDSLQQQASDRQQRISSFINLASTFLYMTNYYIVTPTSGEYAARLGMSEALSGIIIGMTPVAALAASILYSWWSSYSYKRALLFAASCSVLGDILYALALPCNSLSLVIIGRLLNGFGGPRAINRRYIADAFSKSDRTAASAAFVTAGALGMAAGPALAVVAGLVTPLRDPTVSRWWTEETAPGYIMCVLWSTFLLCAYLFFEEPKARNNKPTKATFAPDPEQQPLLLKTNGDTSGQSVSKSNESTPIYKNVAVMTTLGIYFVLKMALECQLSSTATVTKLYFDWDVTYIGTFLAILGLLVFPANMAVAQASRRYEDREILLATQATILVGCLGIIAYWIESYTVFQYVFFSVCLFLGANMLEAPNMSLLTKTIPKSWARGTFNSGLLATEAGTFGRVVGDFVISGAGLVGLDRVLDLTFAPVSVLVAVTMLITWKLFPHLTPPDNDEDDA